MGTTEQSIGVDVPIQHVYAQWTQFESFPQFMSNVDEVTQVDDRHLHWKASILGVSREWDSEITEQHPEERVAWRNTNGTEHAGVVTFHKISDTETRVMLQMDLDPEGLAEKAADAIGVVDRVAKKDLEQFKELIEERGRAQGGWDGEIPREG